MIASVNLFLHPDTHPCWVQTSDTCKYTEPITRCERWIDRDMHEKRRRIMLRSEVEGGTRTQRPQPVPC